MVIETKRLLRHLKRIRVKVPGSRKIREANEIREVVLHGAFEIEAASRNNMVGVVAPPLEGVTPFEGRVHLDLLPLIEFLSKSTVGDQVDLELSEEHLMLNVPGEQQLLLPFPDNRTFHGLDPETAETMKRMATETGVPAQQMHLPEEQRDSRLEDAGSKQSVLDRVESAAKVLKAGRILLEVGPNGGTFKLEGGGTRSEIPHGLASEEPYKLVFDTNSLIPLLRTLQRAEKPVYVHLRGSGSAVVFSDADGFRWLVAPMRIRAVYEPGRPG